MTAAASRRAAPAPRGGGAPPPPRAPPPRRISALRLGRGGPAQDRRLRLAQPGEIEVVAAFGVHDRGKRLLGVRQAAGAELVVGDRQGVLVARGAEMAF